MLGLEVRKRVGGAEVHRVDGGAVTVGASSGNEVVVRARGVAGRHVRISNREGVYHMDLYKGVDAVNVNGRACEGGPILISPGDRIRIGEATITVLSASPSASMPLLNQQPPRVVEVTASPLPATEVEYRELRLAAYRLCQAGGSAEELAMDLTDFLDRELPPAEWAVGEMGPAGFRPLASTFRESPAVPPRLLEEVRGGEAVARSESVAGVLTLVAEPGGRFGSVGILVRETPRLAARAVLFLEELVALADLAFAARSMREEAEPAVRTEAAPQTPEPSVAETVLRQTDDLKKIVETVEREVIDRAMRRAQGNQSRGAQSLNISRGSLIAKLKEYGIPDYRYLRRNRRATR
ncbi:MAG: helix-turn-helix domain-containing protein [Thermoanaerobaculia bacterium]